MPTECTARAGLSSESPVAVSRKDRVNKVDRQAHDIAVRPGSPIDMEARAALNPITSRDIPPFFGVKIQAELAFREDRKRYRRLGSLHGRPVRFRGPDCDSGDYPVSPA